MRFRGLKILLLAVTAAAVLFLLCGAVKTLGMDRWVDFDVYRITGCDRTSIIYDGQSDVVTRLHGVQDRTWVSISELQPSTVYAFISAEDARFFEHEGVDVIRIAGAIVADIKAGSYVQGASTISQQLIKLSHLTSEKTISRKAEEAALAYEMERQYSKEDILEMYLNYVYFGGGYYGIEAAAEGYFGVHASDLTLDQSAMLAGILKSPSGYAPHINYAASINRRNNILRLMRDYGYITDDEKKQASARRPTILHDKREEYSGYYTDAVTKSAAALMGITVDELIRGGYSIYSAMDSDIQHYCEEMFKNGELFPAEDLVETCKELAAQSGGSVTLTESVEEGAKGADVLYTDIWVSMGEPDSVWAERIKLLTPYQINAKVMAMAKPDALFMHCLPSFHDINTTIGKEIADKFGITEMEVSDEVFNSPQSVVFDEAENRMHTIKAVIYATLK
jgi:membrane peptidoglycan carboxypeptidase